jgi:hypothetical protein
MASREAITSLALPDKQMYEELRARLSNPDCKHCRNQSQKVFSSLLQEIQWFVARNDGNDAKRARACGICWLHDGIAVNSAQLGLFIGRKQSSINGSLQRGHYERVPISPDVLRELVTLLPELSDNPKELRKWTIRQWIMQMPREMRAIAPAARLIAGNPAPISQGLRDPSDLSSVAVSNPQLSLSDFPDEAGQMLDESEDWD